MNVKSLLPSPWAFLFDADGQLDYFRLSPFFLNEEMTVYAVCSVQDNGSSIAAFVVAAMSDDDLVLVTDAPIRQVYGQALPNRRFIVVATFIEQNRVALRAHWVGELDSAQLARIIR